MAARTNIAAYRELDVQRTYAILGFDMNALIALTVFLLLLTLSCGRAPEPPLKDTAKEPAVAAPKPVDPKVPPTGKEMIRAVFRMQDVDLSAGQFCNNVGTEFTDKNIGDYISGMMAQIDQPRGRNWIQTSAKAETLPDTGEPVWECEITIRHVYREEVMNWGVRFNLRASDRSLVNGSIMCVGSG
jgi:hypothetical protein